MCIPPFILKMHSTFDEWKKRREGRAGGGSTKGGKGPVTSRVKTFPEGQPESSSGVQSYNQMMRVARERGARPPSEVGSVRSYRSVMTVEEQVGEVERQLEEVKEDIQEMKAQAAETHALLKQLIAAQEQGKGKGK